MEDPIHTRFICQSSLVMGNLPAVNLCGLLPVLKTPRLGVFMEPEVGHGETEVHARVQA